ncbi:hypothetical protein [Palleronia caenipelagi]|uniref:Uncharacterized protein n=1 Tax=Palleronia caenipelagi TaxID=2489174 RepID=A0A547Q7R7_9RHOB|nr:hypothetical protein [Palleronia caenipelagi]TRD22435.1 hypothetical protein FEV53_05090 [Palleronia caenipelagi]
MTPDPSEMLHVIAVDLPMAEATGLAADAGRLAAALSVAQVDPSRVDVIEAKSMGDLGLVTYVTEGEGAVRDAVRGDAERLNAERGAVMILRPRAVQAAVAPQPPLRLLGSYPVVTGKPAGEPVSAASAHGSAAASAAVDPKKRDKRASGIVAMAALAVALFVAFVMWLVAA